PGASGFYRQLSHAGILDRSFFMSTSPRGLCVAPEMPFAIHAILALNALCMTARIQAGETHEPMAGYPHY
ncbi:hypothetical protein, partial [Pseudomonas ficuserectae]